MAVSQALRRLLRVLEIEEEQSRQALEAATGELRRFERALIATSSQARRGRHFLIAGLQNGELPDRLAGLEEIRAAKRRAAALTPRLAQSEIEVESTSSGFSRQARGMSPGRNPHSRDRSQGCRGCRPAKSAGAGRLVPQPAARRQARRRFRDQCDSIGRSGSIGRGGRKDLSSFRPERKIAS